MTLAKKYATFFSLRSLFFQGLAKCETLVINKTAIALQKSNREQFYCRGVQKRA